MFITNKVVRKPDSKRLLSLSHCLESIHVFLQSHREPDSIVSLPKQSIDHSEIVEGVWLFEKETRNRYKLGYRIPKGFYETRELAIYDHDSINEDDLQCFHVPYPDMDVLYTIDVDFHDNYYYITEFKASVRSRNNAFHDVLPLSNLYGSSITFREYSYWRICVGDVFSSGYKALSLVDLFNHVILSTYNFLFQTGNTDLEPNGKLRDVTYYTTRKYTRIGNYYNEETREYRSDIYKDIWSWFERDCRDIDAFYKSLAKMSIENIARNILDMGYTVDNASEYSDEDYDDDDDDY